MKNGIRRELLPLVRLRGIGRVRARRLFNHGITTPDAIISSGISEVTRILGRGVAEQIFAQLESQGRKPGSAETDNEDRGQSTLTQFR